LLTKTQIPMKFIYIKIMQYKTNTVKCKTKLKVYITEKRNDLKK